MSNLYRKDFHHRLTELNNWQIEQQKKIKVLQETQKRLLDLERQNVLSALNNELSDKECSSTEICVSNSDAETVGTKSNTNGHNLKLKDVAVQWKLKPCKLEEPQLSYSGDCCSVVNKKENNISSEMIYELQEKKLSSPKKFLKRGDGLARFRMSLADFKGPPKIYKEKKIKTYLNNKTNSVITKINNQNKKYSRHSVKGSKYISNTSNKSLSIPVKIYVSDTKTKEENKKKIEAKTFVRPHNLQKKNDDINSHLSGEQCLKYSSITSHNIVSEKENCQAKGEVLNDHSSCKVEVYDDLDIENKKDEKELKIFEILEQKINDNSFCSTSSFVDKLLEPSLSSTPSKTSTNGVELNRNSCAQGMKSPCLQLMNDDHITKLEEEKEAQLKQSDKTQSENCMGSQDKIGLLNLDYTTGHDSEGEYDGIKEDVVVSENEKSKPSAYLSNISYRSQPYRINKALLQEYIRNFKRFKINFSKTLHSLEEPKQEMTQKDFDKEGNDEVINQHDIDLKLKRKGLQDNVKHLMNWDNSTRKRLTKRNVKKVKLKQKKNEKTKAIEKDQNEEITFNSTLLKSRLDELGKEIEIFRKENKILEKLQKECSEERLRLAKERKEFEKQMQEEKEKFETSLAEERKKLQKEKVVFEKYCKQIKNQPNRQEREEITNLKKEIEILRETLTTKESRWGSSQARLRNQIKVLERENIRLKSENDECKRLPIRKVTFENDGSINTKIINAINSEINKLKPTVMKDVSGSLHGKNKSLSARVYGSLERKPIRRIKSAPNIKKLEATDVIKEVLIHDKATSSVSKDSGIEANDPFCISLPQTNKTIESNVLSGDAHKFSKADKGEKPKEHIKSFYINDFDESRDDGRSDISEGSIHDFVESFTQEADDCIESESGNFSLKYLGRSGLCNVLEGESDHVERMTKLSGDASNYHTGIETKRTEKCLVEDSEIKKSQSRTTDNFEKKGTQRKIDLLENLYYHEEYLTENIIEESRVRERISEDGAKEICYPNGNIKKIYPGNKIVKIVYYNGDIKETNVVEGSEKYYYAETKTWHTTYKDGFEVLEFPNGQTERRHPNGTTEISFPNGCVRYCDLFGRDEWRFVDGTVIKTNQSGHKILLMPNGQKEIHTKEFKRREYPDGTVKMLYADGSQETRYACGRVRLKDKTGNLVMDSQGIS